MSESAQAKISLTAIHAKMRVCSWLVINTLKDTPYREMYDRIVPTTTIHGKPALLIEGYLFRLDRATGTGKSWRCTNRGVIEFVRKSCLMCALFIV